MQFLQETPKNLTSGTLSLGKALVARQGGPGGGPGADPDDPDEEPYPDDTKDYQTNRDWANSQISVPPRVNWLDNPAFTTPQDAGRHRYWRQEGVGQDQFVYVVEDCFDWIHPVSGPD